MLTKEQMEIYYIPEHPDVEYAGKGWKGWDDFLSGGTVNLAKDQTAVFACQDGTWVGVDPVGDLIGSRGGDRYNTAEEAKKGVAKFMRRKGVKQAMSERLAKGQRPIGGKVENVVGGWQVCRQEESGALVNPYVFEHEADAEAYHRALIMMGDPEMAASL